MIQVFDVYHQLVVDQVGDHLTVNLQQLVQEVALVVVESSSGRKRRWSTWCLLQQVDQVTHQANQVLLKEILVLVHAGGAPGCRSRWWRWSWWCRFWTANWSLEVILVVVAGGAGSNLLLLWDIPGSPFYQQMVHLQVVEVVVNAGPGGSVRFRWWRFSRWCRQLVAFWITRQDQLNTGGGGGGANSDGTWRCWFLWWFWNSNS